MRLEGEARLRRPVPSLWSAGWLVREQPDTLESVPRDGVRGRLQRAGVVGACNAVAAVSATCDSGMTLHPPDPFVSGETGADLHQDGMTPAVGVEDFLAGQCDLDRASGDDGQLGGHQLVRKNVALAPEAATVWGGDHADAAHRQLEHFAQRAVHVVWRLRGG